MKDVEYVKSVLAGEYETEHPHEIPYPELDEVVGGTSFDFVAGTVEGEVPNGSVSREGLEYLWFKHGKKSILSHRFIAAVTLGKWVPRDFDVDHVNHNPSDNRPTNLRIVTRRDNAGNRRKALLSELSDLEGVSADLRERKAKEAAQAVPVPEPEPEVVPIPKLEPASKPKPFYGDPYGGMLAGGPIPTVTYTGETKPAEHSNGTWYKTNLGSWHLRFD
ncbi:HNH endonuclease signature motif containing protein [Arenibacterium sp. CAU 1754]